MVHSFLSQMGKDGEIYADDELERERDYDG
jgi:hypothetical protein